MLYISREEKGYCYFSDKSKPALKRWLTNWLFFPKKIKFKWVDDVNEEFLYGEVAIYDRSGEVIHKYPQVISRKTFRTRRTAKSALHPMCLITLHNAMGPLARHIWIDAYKKGLKRDRISGKLKKSRKKKTEEKTGINFGDHNFSKIVNDTKNSGVRSKTNPDNDQESTS